MAMEPGDAARRRAALGAQANPAPWHDYLVRWAGTLAGGTRLVIDYVPDRQVLTPAAFAGYLALLEVGPWATLESLVVAVLDDLNNELVPRWVQVAAHHRQGTTRHHAVAEDRQPDWDNPGLLARWEQALPGR
jgi:hypothetical protein